MNATVRHSAGLRRSVSASVPSGLLIAVDVRNTIDGERDEDDRDRLELALEVGDGADLDRLGDLLHLRGALVLGQDDLREEEADGDGEEGGGGRQDTGPPTHRP